MSRLIIGSRAELIAALRAQEAPLAVGEAVARAAYGASLDDTLDTFYDEEKLRDELGVPPAAYSAARAEFDARMAELRRALEAEVAPVVLRRGALAERRRALAEELFLDALFLVAQFPGGQIPEAEKCCYAYDVRLCAGLCRAAWAEEAFWSGLVRVQHPGRLKVTRLMYAAAHGDAARVRWLLARGAPREAKDVYGHTALSMSSAEGNVDATRTLLAAGANVNASTDWGITPLYCTAEDGNVDIARALLAAGANIDAADAQGFAPLHITALGGHVGVMRLLLAAGASVNGGTNDGCAPLYMAAQNDHTEAMRVLLAAGACDEAAGADGWRPLHIASSQGHVAAATLLLDAGADASMLLNDGRSTLDLAYSPGMRALLAARGV
jgi:ankyrin repeat protein